MTSKKKISLSTSNFNQDLNEALHQSKNLIVENSIENFENALELYLGNNKKIAALNSGTAAIHLALILAGISKGDTVICQSFTFSASANPILYQGASPIFIDSEKDTWNMCPIQLENAILKSSSAGKKPKVIIVVHLYGMPAKIAAIMEIAAKYNILVIEDAAEALGASYNNQLCGTFGDFGILSFNNNKIISAFGGGALVCKNEVIHQKAVFLATQSREQAPHYQHCEIGYNYRISPLIAAIGNYQLNILNDCIYKRRSINQFYKSLFINANGVTVFEEPTNKFFSTHWLSCIVIDASIAGFSREDLRIKLLENGIESRPLWKPMHLQPVFKSYEFSGTTVSENLFEQGLCLPSSAILTDEDKNRIAKVISDILV